MLQDINQISFNQNQFHSTCQSKGTKSTFCNKNLKNLFTKAIELDTALDQLKRQSNNKKFAFYDFDQDEYFLECQCQLDHTICNINAENLYEKVVELYDTFQGSYKDEMLEKSLTLTNKFSTQSTLASSQISCSTLKTPKIQADQDSDDELTEDDEINYKKSSADVSYLKADLAKLKKKNKKAEQQRKRRQKQAVLNREAQLEEVAVQTVQTVQDSPLSFNDSLLQQCKQQEEIINNNVQQKIINQTINNDQLQSQTDDILYRLDRMFQIRCKKSEEF